MLKCFSWVPNAFVRCGWVERKVETCFRSKKSQSILTDDWHLPHFWMWERTWCPFLWFPWGEAECPNCGLHHPHTWQHTAHFIEIKSLAIWATLFTCEPCVVLGLFLLQEKHIFSVFVSRLNTQYSWRYPEVSTVSFLINILCFGLCAHFERC